MQRYSRNKFWLIVPGSLLLLTGLQAQLKSDLPQLDSSPRLKSLASPSWFDPQRFSMSHGFSISLMSGSGLYPGATSVSVYTNQMRYLVANNLLLSSQIHVVQPGMWGTQPGGNNPLLYYQAGMDWRLFDKVDIHLGISNLPPLRRYSPWYRPSMSPFPYKRTLDQTDITDN